MDPHRRAEERSVAYHRAIAARLRARPEILEAARRRVDEWMAAAVVPHFARQWQRILTRDLDAIGAFLVERSARADELRQSSPFAGALPARERWRIWRAYSTPEQS